MDYPLNRPDDPTKLEAPVDILCSYHYFKDVDLGRLASFGNRIIADSGAFSAMGGTPIDRDEFHAWADRWKDDVLWVASLDVIGDPDATYANWMAGQRDNLELIPTLHYGAPPEAMDRYADHGATLIGLGGMVPYSSEKNRLMRWCLSMFRYARDNHPDIRFHGWGISHQFLVDNLPWWSTDSSGYSSAFRFATLRLWDPPALRFRGVALDGRDPAKYQRILRRYYGISWKQIARSVPENKRILARVAIRSMQLYENWLKTRQFVEAPAVLGDAGTGMNQALVMAPSAQVAHAVTHDGRSISHAAPWPPQKVSAP